MSFSLFIYLCFLSGYYNFTIIIISCTLLKSHSKTVYSVPKNTKMLNYETFMIGILSSRFAAGT